MPTFPLALLLLLLLFEAFHGSSFSVRPASSTRATTVPKNNNNRGTPKVTNAGKRKISTTKTSTMTVSLFSNPFSGDINNDSGSNNKTIVDGGWKTGKRSILSFGNLYVDDAKANGTEQNVAPCGGVGEGATCSNKITITNITNTSTTLGNDDEFSSWVESLSRWPLYPSTTSTTINNDSESGSPITGGSSSNSNDNSSVKKTQLPPGNGAKTHTATELYTSILDRDRNTGADLSSISSRNNTSHIKSIQTSSRFRSRMNPLVNLVDLFEMVLLEDYNRDQSNNYKDDNNSSNIIFDLADQLFRNVVLDAAGLFPSKESTSRTEAGYVLEMGSIANRTINTDAVSTTTTVQDLFEQEEWLQNLVRTIGTAPFLEDAAASNSSRIDVNFNLNASRLSVTQASAISASGRTNGTNITRVEKQALDSILKDATARMEFLVQEASTLASPSVIPELMDRTSHLFAFLNKANKQDKQEPLPPTASALQFPTLNASAMEFLSLPAPQKQLLQDTTNYAGTFMTVANAIFSAGYVDSSSKSLMVRKLSPTYASASTNTLFDQVDTVEAASARPLFSDFESASSVQSCEEDAVVQKGAEMGTLAGAIYEDTLSRVHGLGHALVARGKSADVAWMVTDSIEVSPNNRHEEQDPSNVLSSYSSSQDFKPRFIRTITIRGFDASDDTVDRERLLNVICTPEPRTLCKDHEGVLVHSGLLQTAKAIYQDVIQYVDWSSPNQKLVLNGHSIGGSLAILMLLLMTVDRGVDFVLEKVLRVYTHGSPPIAKQSSSQNGGAIKNEQHLHECAVLKEFDLPSTIVFGYVQPYDPIVRFLTQWDPLYPLVDDLSGDENTLYASGPRRSLRPITRVILSSWDGWPEFRENWKRTNQEFQSVGIQHLLLPDPQRYLTDRFVSPNVGVPPTDQIVRVSSRELLPLLAATFPLDVFQISLIPQAVRSFLHHFYPAYDASIANYALKLSKQADRGKKDNLSPTKSMEQQPEPTQSGQCSQ